MSSSTNSIPEDRSSNCAHIYRSQKCTLCGKKNPKRKGKGAKQRDTEAYRYAQNVEFDRMRQAALEQRFGTSSMFERNEPVSKVVSQDSPTDISEQATICPQPITRMHDHCVHIRPTDLHIDEEVSDALDLVEECQVLPFDSWIEPNYNFVLQLSEETWRPQSPESPDLLSSDSNTSCVQLDHPVEAACVNEPTPGTSTQTEDGPPARSCCKSELVRNPSSRYIIPVKQAVTVSSPFLILTAEHVSFVHPGPIDLSDVSVCIYAPPNSGKSTLQRFAMRACRLAGIFDTDTVQGKYPRGSIVFTNRHELLGQIKKGVCFAFIPPQGIFNARCHELPNFSRKWFWSTNIQGRVIVIRSSNFLASDISIRCRCKDARTRVTRGQTRRRVKDQCVQYDPP